MPRHPDPDLEERILHAADLLWRRGGEHALTMRAVARAARTNTPAVYRRFRDREDLVKELLLRIMKRLRAHFDKAETLEEMAEAYMAYALSAPHEYGLFFSRGRLLSPRKGHGAPRPIRESRPNFAYVEELLAKQIGGTPDDHTQLVLTLWAILHGTAMMLLSKSLEGHEEELRNACRAGVKSLLGKAGAQKIRR